MLDDYIGKESLENRRKEILTIVKEISELIWYSHDLEMLYRVSQNWNNASKWDFFSATHSEMNIWDSDKRWYAIDFKSWEKVVISIDWSLIMDWYKSISLNGEFSRNPRIWSLIQSIKAIELGYRRVKDLSITCSDEIHRSLMPNNDE